MRHKIAVLLIGAAFATLSGIAAARDNVSFGISLGVPVAPVYVAPPPVYYDPPVYYGPSFYYGGPPVYYYGHPYRGWDARIDRYGGYRHGRHGRHGR